PAEDILRISAKSGLGIHDVLEKVVNEVPPPAGNPEKPFRALVFDSHYDVYKGVVAYVRIIDGEVRKRDSLTLMATNAKFDPVEIGVFSPNMTVIDTLEVGSVGYIATGLKTIQECRVGDTITLTHNGAKEALPGYTQVKPM